jgi:hypothetical protein
VASSFVPPGTVPDGSLSFLGVLFDDGEGIARVRITTGKTALGPHDGNGGLLLQRLARAHFANLSPGLGADLLAYYRDRDAGAAGKAADDILSALAELQSIMSAKRPG